MPHKAEFATHGYEQVRPASVFRVLEFHDDRNVVFNTDSGVGMESRKAAAGL